MNIAIDQGTLVIRRDTSFAELDIFMKNHPEHDEYFKSCYLLDMGDAGSWDVPKKFVKLLNSQSNLSIYSFFIENKLYDPNYSKADEDLRIFYHTKFI